MLERIKEYFKPHNRIARMLREMADYVQQERFHVAAGQLREMASDFENFDNPNRKSYCLHPSNDDDIDGIVEYLTWTLSNAGAPSDCFHYMEVLTKKLEEKKEK